jgi:pimeloyl-ACP methyl ester carboxylesterase
MDLFDTRKATQLIPQGQFKLIKGVGHFLHWEQPDILPIYENFFEIDSMQKINLSLA